MITSHDTPARYNIENKWNHDALVPRVDKRQRQRQLIHSKRQQYNANDTAYYLYRLDGGNKKSARVSLKKVSGARRSWTSRQ